MRFGRRLSRVRQAPEVYGEFPVACLAEEIETPGDGRARKDSYLIRRAAVNLNVPYYLTVDGAQAAIGAIEALLKGEIHVRTLQEYHADA